jgi:iron(III) transport system substrate-binding protein
VKRRQWLLGMASLGGCRLEWVSPASQPQGAADVVAGKVVLYTSLYPEVIEPIQAALRVLLPDVELLVFQGGSEKLAQRLLANRQAGHAGADVLLTSDPLLYLQLAHEDTLLPTTCAAATPIPRPLVDDDNRFVGARVSSMVWVGKGNAPPPQPLSALVTGLDARSLAMPDPLSSGTCFTTMVQLAPDFDVSFIGRLKREGALIGGGNSVVIQRVLQGERAVGMCLLENALAARARGEDIAIAWPTDGAVLIVGHAAVLRDAANPRAAQALINALLSPVVQQLMVAPGHMHSVLPRLSAPGDGSTPSLTSVLAARPLAVTDWSVAMTKRSTMLEQLSTLLSSG